MAAELRDGDWVVAGCWAPAGPHPGPWVGPSALCSQPLLSTQPLRMITRPSRLTAPAQTSCAGPELQIHPSSLQVVIPSWLSLSTWHQGVKPEPFISPTLSFLSSFRDPHFCRGPHPPSGPFSNTGCPQPRGAVCTCRITVHLWNLGPGLAGGSEGQRRESNYRPSRLRLRCWQECFFPGCQYEHRVIFQHLPTAIIA